MNEIICPNCKKVFKVDDLTIKKLTHGNPTMKARFDGLSDKTE